MISIRFYEIRLRKDHRGVDLISDALPFGRLWYNQLGKAQMKTILMLIVGLMLAGCGSMENHVRNNSVASTSQPPLPDPGDTIAVDTICACP